MPAPDTQKLVLASSSPRRRDLLNHLGLRFEVDPADYPGWTSSTEYAVARYTATGDAVCSTEARTGPFVVTDHVLEPGDITWWILRQRILD